MGSDGVGVVLLIRLCFEWLAAMGGLPLVVLHPGSQLGRSQHRFARRVRGEQDERGEQHIYVTNAVAKMRI